jgi:uncharacterized membrane protein YpjA
MVINLLGSGFGYYYYKSLLAASPLWLWIFIPDSPNSTLLFSLAIFLILMGRGSSTLSALGSVYVMKYGLWTMFVILYYSEYFLSPPLTGYYWLMFWLHFGMVIEPVVILHTLEKGKRVLLIPLIWLLINDFFDYGLGTTPLLRLPLESPGMVALFSLGETILFSVLVYALAGSRALERIWQR